MNADPAARGRRRLVFVLAVSTAAAPLAWVFFLGGFRGVLYDSYHYFTLSQIVSGEGLWNLQSRVRTYGYPLFVSLCTGFAEVGAESLVAHVPLVAVSRAVRHRVRGRAGQAVGHD